ncbi:MAG: hypothetical protein JNK05_28530 [Myxococcales bacterium]|nr:hypothetical protein [Myxococcales bacterium]
MNRFGPLGVLSLVVCVASCVRIPRPSLADGATAGDGNVEDAPDVVVDAADGAGSDASDAATDVAVDAATDAADATRFEAGVGYLSVPACPASDAGTAAPEVPVRCDRAPGCCPAGQLCANGVCTEEISLHGAQDQMCVRVRGSFSCWGQSSSGATGNTLTTPFEAPPMLGDTSTLGPVYAMSTHGFATEFIVGPDRSVGFLGGREAFGETDEMMGVFGRDPLLLTGLREMRSLAQPSRSGVRCGVGLDGQVRCWGCNRNGALGDGNNPAPPCASGPSSPRPFTVTSSVPVAQVAIASSRTGDRYSTATVCALSARGSVRCWGANEDGQRGNNRRDGDGDNVISAAGASEIPSLVATEIAGLDSAFCALRDGNQIVCWGNRGSYGAGQPSETSLLPEVLTRSNSAALHKLRCGAGGCCAIERASRSLWCWGVQDGTNHRIVPSGPDTTGVAPTLIRPVGIADGTIEDVGVGDSICALGRTGTMQRVLVCWGENNAGEAATARSATPIGFNTVVVSGL